jgi:hypothetical protein
MVVGIDSDEQFQSRSVDNIGMLCRRWLGKEGITFGTVSSRSSGKLGSHEDSFPVRGDTSCIGSAVYSALNSWEVLPNKLTAWRSKALHFVWKHC